MEIKNNKGFTLYSFILATPLLFTLAVSSSWLIWFLNQKHRLDNLCQFHTLKAQEELVKANNSVLRLNYKAYALIIEKRALDLTMLTAPPPIAAAAKVRRRFVVGQQHILKKTQKGFIYKGNLKAKLLAVKLRKNFVKHLRELERHWGASPSFPDIQIYWSDSKIKRKFSEIAPPYKRQTGHSSLQEIRAQWKIPLKAISPDWIKNFVHIKKSWSGECSSHPKKRRFQWEAHIGKAKPSSKQLL